MKKKFFFISGLKCKEACMDLKQLLYDHTKKEFNEVVAIKSASVNNINFTMSNTNNKFSDYCVRTNANKFGLIQKIIRADNDVFVLVNEIVYLYSPFYLNDSQAANRSLKSNVSIFSLSKNFFLENILNLKKIHLLNFDKTLNLLYVSQFEGGHLFT